MSKLSKLLPLGLACGVASLVTIACSDEAGGTRVPTSSVSAALDGAATIPLVGPAQCQSRATLFQCAIPAGTLEATPGTTAVPLRSTVSVVAEGKCDTRYDLRLLLDTDGEPTTFFPFTKQSSIAVRRRDGGRIETIRLSGEENFKRLASFDLTCRLRVQAAFNEPDVYSAEEARAIIARLESQLADKKRIRDSLKDLVGYVTALNFVRSTLDRFWSVLTADELRDLRPNAEAATNTLSTLAFGCGSLSNDDLANVMRVMIAIPALGSSGEFDAPDGGRLSLGQYLGANAPAVKTSLEQVVLKVTPDGGTVHDGDYEASVRAVNEAEAGLALARVQLAAWL